MNSAVPPRAELRQPPDDDDTTRLMLPSPSSVAPLTMAPKSTAMPARRSSRKLALGALALGLFGGLGALAGPPLCAAMRARGASPVVTRAAAALVSPMKEAQAAAAEQPPAVIANEAPAAAPARAAQDRADATLERSLINPIFVGFVTIPSSFESADGAYDLVVHFHGHNKLIEESFDHARINAVVTIVNLGLGSGAYESQFSGRLALPAIIERTQAMLEKRGLRGAKLRRVALSAFSAGYAAVRGILNQPGMADQIDAVLLLDGIHTGFMPRDHSLDLERLGPFSRFAAQAVAGKKLFSITHSEITPNGDYASTHATTDALVALVGAERRPSSDVPAVPSLPSVVNVEKLAPLVPLSEARKGQFHVRGFAGTDKPDHIMHMAQMSETVIPELVRYWSAPAAR